MPLSTLRRSVMASQDSERFLFIFPDFQEEHPELAYLTPGEYVEWFGILLRQLRYGYTYSIFYPNGVAPRRVKKFLEIGFLEERDGVLHICDWEEWNGRKEFKRMLNRERQRKWYERQKLSRKAKK